MQVIIWDLVEPAEALLVKLEEAHAEYTAAAEQTAAAIVAVKAAVKAQEALRMGKNVQKEIR